MTAYPSIGETFGSYAVTGILGRGGMGVVFSAVHVGLDRKVALKILSPELALQQEFRDRFSREASALAHLYSPHVIDIYEHGELDGCLYIVTQHVEGVDLARELEDRGGLPPVVALDIVQQVASALSDAHDAGVVHRDVKPSNVLLRSLAPGEYFAYLCDFGIAHTNDQDRTRTGGVIGTLAYMAPERHQGQGASTSTDIYSLGCVLWATLAGRSPYEGTDVEAAIQHLRGPVPTYPAVGSAGGAINAILARSMAKQPADRYPSAEAMREDLLEARREALADPEQGQRTWPETAQARQGGPRPSGRRVAALAASLVGVVAAIGLGFWAWSSMDPETGTSADDKLFTCWNKQQVIRRGYCADPDGLAGLRWVYPSFHHNLADCRRRPDANPDPALRSWFCPAPGGASDDGIRYTEWQEVGDAKTHFDRVYDQAPSEAPFVVEGRPVGYRWARTDPNEKGSYKMTMVYSKWPFSLSVYARSKADLEKVCSAVVVRTPQEFQEVRPACSVPEATDADPTRAADRLASSGASSPGTRQNGF